MYLEKSSLNKEKILTDFIQYILKKNYKILV